MNKLSPSSSSVDPHNSLTGVDSYDYDEQLVVLYNRVPKTGSTSFVNIAYDLCKKNKFHVLHINVTANMHVLSLPNQVGTKIMECSIINNFFCFLSRSLSYVTLLSGIK